jgi:hypothetical protein
MALEFNPTLFSINADCETFSLIDETVYGGANPLRVDLAVYMTGVKKNNLGDDTPLTILPEVTDKFTVAKWAVESSLDGWHSFTMYGLTVWDSGTSYVTGDAIYDNGNVYKALRASTNAPPATSGSDWVAVQELSEINDAGNIEYGLTDINITCRSEICYSKVVSQAALAMCNNSCDTLLEKHFREVDVLLQGANVKCLQERNAEFETIIRALDNVCEDFGPCANC